MFFNSLLGSCTVFVVFITEPIFRVAFIENDCFSKEESLKSYRILFEQLWISILRIRNFWRFLQLQSLQRDIKVIAIYYSQVNIC